MEKVYNELYNHCIIHGRYGFTIPYIFNAYNSNYNSENLSEILRRFVNAPKSYIVTFCSDLQEFILGLHKPSEQAPLQHYSNFGNLYYDDSILGHFSKEENLIAFLTEKYLPIIQEKKYSKNSKP
ncbi:hypothetical protein [uncultured Sphingobacterium sp.]|uniref:hypothetical protein n=1 Tax=uncultured Sphingobacterium sp. TaxID=182688 RepID=UPI0025E7A796|nr:hypothetical protein [uncultured Sphingobacterium sp.]